MTDSTSKTPKAFLSYSHDSPSHRGWVKELASRLRGDGVETILDQWELAPGDQIPEFMERAVRENDFVLIICTPRYKDRSDARTGGVGYEGDIMTGEVYRDRNHRKFIPILRVGDWSEAAPTWLTGKLHVDLRGEPYSEENYQELLTSLLGTRPKPPPVKPAVVRRDPAAIPIPTPEIEADKPFEPIKILGIVEEEVGHPANDGTRGSGLYEVPFRLSAVPPYEWAEAFVQNWDHPPSWTSMHQPGIAEVIGDRLILNRTTLEHVERHHQATLKLALQETNRAYSEYLARQKQQAEQERREREEHERAVRERAKKIKFD
jgi:hypothetical protein